MVGGGVSLSVHPGPSQAPGGPLSDDPFPWCCCRSKAPPHGGPGQPVKGGDRGYLGVFGSGAGNSTS